MFITLNDLLSFLLEDNQKLKIVQSTTHASYFNAELYGKLLQLTIKNKNSVMSDYLNDTRPNSPVWIAYFNNEPVGWCLLVESNDEKYFKIGIFVSPTYRKQNIGSVLLGHAKKFAMKYKKPLLSYPIDRKSKRFYQTRNITKSPTKDFDFD